MLKGFKPLSHSKENVSVIPQEESHPDSKIRHQFGGTDEMNTGESRRNYLRIPIVTTAHATSLGHQISAKVVVRDISVEGMGGYTNCPYEKGEIIRVKLKFTLPYNRVVGESILAEVRWSAKVDQGERYAFGFRFYDVQEKNPGLYTYLRELEDQFLTA